MTDRGTCGTCAHYRAVGNDPTLCCTKRPSVAMMTAVPHPEKPGDVVVQKFTYFPSPEPQWSCGEHRSKLLH